jgi:colicin import membrane protein
MKYLQSKHEKNAARMTTLLTLIIVLLLFFVSSPPYMDPPEEYGVAINFGSPSQINDVIQKSAPSIPQDTNSHNIADSSTPEERVEDVIEEILEETIEKPVEEIIEETVDEALKNNQDQDVLTQDIEAAIKIKAAEKLAKEKSETAKKEIEAKQKAQEKAEADMKARAKAFKAKADKVAKEKSDAIAKAAEEKALKAAAQKKANEIGGRGSKVVSFKAVENPPIYPGCELVAKSERKKCMSDKINTFFSENFDKEMPGDIGLKGIQTISTTFKINQQGSVVGVMARAADKRLVAEAKRVAKLLPRFKPALQNGMPVTVPFNLPLKIQTGK